MVRQFVIKSLVLSFLILLSLVVVIFVIPDKNDYHEALIDKHTRLANTNPPRVIFVGGSSLAFGLDSRAVQDSLRWPIVNMGLDATFGLRFILDEVKPSLRPHDVIVIIPEYMHFSELLEGRERTLMHLVKAFPGALRYINTPHQYQMILAGIPDLVQIKVDRLVRTALKSAVGDRKYRAQLRTSGRIYARAAFNEFGDVTSHLNEKGPSISFGEDPTAVETECRTDAVELLNEFALYAETCNARVYLRYGSLPSHAYSQAAGALQILHMRLNRELNIGILGSPADYVLPDSNFFDSIYHVTAEGRRINTLRTVTFLRTVLEVNAEDFRGTTLRNATGERLD